jgi:hypothetical protein
VSACHGWLRKLAIGYSRERIWTSHLKGGAHGTSTPSGDILGQDRGHTRLLAGA